MELNALFDVREEKGLEQGVVWGVAKFDRASFRDEPDIATVVPVNICNVLPVTFHGCLLEGEEELIWITRTLVVVPSNPLTQKLPTFLEGPVLMEGALPFGRGFDGRNESLNRP